MRLTEKETSILKYLYRSGTKVVGRETLLREVFGYNARVGRCALPQAQSLTQSWPEKQES